MLVLRRLILIFPLLMPVSAWAKPVVADARIGDDGNVTRIELQASDTLHFHAFYLSDPDRVVIDLDEVDWRVSAGHQLQGSGLVSALRYGLFKVGTSRVVLDLQQPAAVASIGMGGSPDHQNFVIDLRSVSKAAFRTAVRDGVMPAKALATTEGTADQATAPADRKSAIAQSSSPVGPDQADTSSGQDLGKSAAKSVAKETSQISGKANKSDQQRLAAMVPAPETKSNAGAKTDKPKTKPASKPIIVIDAGHGGVDPGALGNGVMEKNITLSVALALKKELLATGRYRVALTRETDIYIPLRDRFKIAREKGADLFISLHADSHNDPFMRGASVYTLSETASDAEAAELANQENKSDIIAGVDLSKQSGMVTDILIDLAQRDTINQSSTFATELVSELKSDTLMLEHSHRSAGFAVLKAPDVPSVLIEMGYISSDKDEALLSNRQHQARLAKAMRRAVDDFFSGREPTQRS